MGDYRNELQSALTQAEALRAENAALRMKLRAAGVDIARAEPSSGPFEPPLDTPSLRRSSRPLAAAGIAVVASLALAGYVTARSATRRAPEEPLVLPNLPEVRERSAVTPAPLPLPPTSVRLPVARSASETITEVRDMFIMQDPIAIDASRALGLRWPRDNRSGLYVLHTTQSAQCSVGGLLLEAPTAAFVTAGTHRVRCQVGRIRHVWDVAVAPRRVTFDTLHDVGSP